MSVANIKTLSLDTGLAPAHLLEARNSKNKLNTRVSQVFRKHVTDLKQISPYESTPFSNYPGATNLLYLPGGVAKSAKHLYRSLKNKDWEEAQDTTVSLAGAPANFASGVGTVIDYGVVFHIIPTALKFLIPLGYFFGVLLCTAEGVIDIVSLMRQRDFTKDFDFSLLGKLSHLIYDFDPVKSPKALNTVLQAFENKNKNFEALFGEEQTQQIQTALNKIQKEINQRPLHYREVLKKYAPTLNEISRHLLIANLFLLQKEFLEVTPEEIEKIQAEISSNGSMPSDLTEEQLVELNQKLEGALVTKQKNLARRIRPWMVSKACQTTVPLIQGLIKNDPEAVKEGLKLTKSIDIQIRKKTIVHILGIVALAIVAVSLLTLMIGCPMAISYVLVVLATTIAFSRMIAYKTTLDTDGWHTDWKALLPAFLRKEEKKEEVPPPFPVPGHGRLTHRFELNPIAMKC